MPYYGYRYYNPELGRWISRDPAEEKGGLNLYQTSNNDTISNFDVLGLLVRCTSWIWTFETEWRYTGAEQDMEQLVRSITIWQQIIGIIDRFGVTGPVQTINVYDIYRSKEAAKYRKYIRACVELLKCHFYPRYCN